MFVYSPDIEGLVKWANSSDEIDFSDISALFGEKSGSLGIPGIF